MKNAVQLMPLINTYDVVSLSEENIFSAAKFDNFQSNFHGDLIPEINPCTLAGAIKLYESLPVDKAKSVPKLIDLMPLSKMISVNSVSVDLISHVEEIMEHFHFTEMFANDLMKTIMHARILLMLKISYRSSRNCLLVLRVIL